MDKFSMIISSDPQYPWYDQVLPAGLSSESEIQNNAQRQISQQYQSMGLLAEERKNSGSAYLIQGVLINGDLTAFGHGWQYDMYTTLLGFLPLPSYPMLGNHDYANNVNDSDNNNCASRMVDFMYNWLKSNQGKLVSYDFSEREYYKFPEMRKDYSGSLSYSFNIGKLHFVQLQNFPSYTAEWNSWNLSGARRDFYYIEQSFYWLENDLAKARNKGDIILVSLHDYHDNFIEPYVTQFNNLLLKYGVSAVFAGHIHPNCGEMSLIQNTIPFFRSGSASYQDYLVADIDVAAKIITVQKMADAGEEGNYNFVGNTWQIQLNDTIPQPPMPVPPTEGYVTFFNDGGYVAKGELSYTYNDQAFAFKTGDMNLGNKTTYDIPPGAKNVWLFAEEKTGLVWDPWKTIFDLTFAAPPNKCFKLFGTTLSPKWNNDCQ